MLLKTVAAKSLRPEQIISHRFLLDDIAKAYDTFGNAAKEHAMKVLIAAAGA
jgi:alcohol dehydrogenase